MVMARYAVTRFALPHPLPMTANVEVKAVGTVSARCAPTFLLQCNRDILKLALRQTLTQPTVHDLAEKM